MKNHRNQFWLDSQKENLNLIKIIFLAISHEIYKMKTSIIKDKFNNKIILLVVSHNLLISSYFFFWSSVLK